MKNIVRKARLGEIKTHTALEDMREGDALVVNERKIEAVMEVVYKPCDMYSPDMQWYLRSRGWRKFDAAWSVFYRIFTFTTIGILSFWGGFQFFYYSIGKTL